MSQLDLFAMQACSTSEAETRRFGRMDGLTGMPRLNDFRLKLQGPFASVYDEGYLAAIAELIAKQGTPA